MRSFIVLCALVWPMMVSALVTVTENTTLTDSSWDGEDVVVDGSGVELMLSGQRSYAFNSLSIINGAVVTHDLLSFSSDEHYSITVTGTLEIDAASSIDVSGKGREVPVGERSSVGGSHGGWGGAQNSSYVPVTAPYGDYRSPINSGIASNDTGSSSGGAIELTVGFLDLKGGIYSNAQGASYHGGSGGAVLIHATDLQVGAAAAITASGDGATGAGGRIAIYCDNLIGATDIDFLGKLKASDGTVIYPSYISGAPGTVYYKNASTGVSFLKVESETDRAQAWRYKKAFTDIELAGPENLVITNANVRLKTAGFVVSVTATDSLIEQEDKAEVSDFNLEGSVWRESGYALLGDSIDLIRVSPSVTVSELVATNSAAVLGHAVLNQALSTSIPIVWQVVPTADEFVLGLADAGFNASLEQAGFYLGAPNNPDSVQSVGRSSSGSFDLSLQSQQLSESRTGLSANTVYTLVYDPIVGELWLWSAQNGWEQLNASVALDSAVGWYPAASFSNGEVQFVVDRGVMKELPSDLDVRFPNWKVYGSTQFSGDVVRVGPDRLYTTINAAIAAANEGDVILIDEGVYDESVTLTKYVHLKGNTDSPDKVIIRYTGLPQAAFSLYTGGAYFENQDFARIHHPLIIEGLTIERNTPSVVGVSDSEISLLFNRTKMIHGVYQNPLSGPINNNGNQKIIIRNSYLGANQSYTEYINSVNDDTLYLDKVLVPSGLTTSSSQSFPRFADYQTESSTNTESGYGPDYGDWLIPLDKPVVVADSGVDPKMFVSYSEFAVVFKYEIDPSTFAADDINLTDANGNPISIVSIQAIDNKTFQITLPAGLAEGQYNLSIGPDIQGIDGSRMDQNDDAVDDGDLDAYTLSFEVDLTPFKIRVAADYTSAMCPDVSVACCESDRSWCNNVQAAVDIAEEGDLVLIEPGEYIDSIHINKYVHLKGNSLDPSDVVLQGDESQVGGTTNVVGISGFDDAIRSPMVIEGLTVRPYQGGSSSSSFAFDHNLFNDTVLINRVRSEIASASNQNHLLNVRGGMVTIRNSRFEGAGAVTSGFANNYPGRIGVEASTFLTTFLYRGCCYNTIDPADYVSAPQIGYGPSYGAWMFPLDIFANIAELSLSPFESQQVTSFTVRFTSPIPDGQFDGTDISIQNGPVMPSGYTVTRIDESAFTVSVSEPLTEGIYQLNIGPNIQTVSGNLMNTDLDDIPGEAEDAYTFSFEVDSTLPSAVVISSHQVGQLYKSNSSSVTVSGSKELTSSLWVNGILMVESGATDWEFPQYWGIELPLSSGINDYVFIAKDAAGNASLPKTLTFDVDTQAPQITSDDIPDYSATTLSAFNVQYSDNQSLDTSSSRMWVTNIGLGSEVAGRYSFGEGVITFVPDFPLAEGAYSVQAELVDQHGNTGTFSQTVTLDFTAPAIPVINAYPSQTTQATLVLEGTNEAYSRLYINDQLFDQDDGTNWSYSANFQVGVNQYVIVAKDYAGNESDPLTVSITFDDQVPGPVVLSVDPQGDGTQVVLDWSTYDEVANGADIAHYLVYQSTSTFTDLAQASQVALVAGAKSWVATGLQPDQFAYFAVVAVDQGGSTSPEFNVVAVQPVDVVPPAEAVNLEVSGSTTTTLNLKWGSPATGSADVYAYHVYLENYTGTQPIEILSTGQATITTDVTGLNPGSAYPITVKTVDAANNESAGITNAGVTALTNPTVTVTAELDSKVTISWVDTAAPQLVASYKVYVSSNGPISDVSALEPTLVLSEGESSRSVAGLVNGQTYYLAVTAVNLSGIENKAVSSVNATPTADTNGPTIDAINFVSTSGTAALSGGSILTESGKFSVSASDESGIARVEFSLAEISATAISLGTDYTAAPNYEQSILLSSYADGSYTLEVTVYDTLNNPTVLAVPLTIDLAAPNAPVFTAPASDLTTNANSMQVAGTSQSGTQVHLIVNGVELSQTASVNSLGTFTSTVELVEGPNNIVAYATTASRPEDPSANTGTLTITLDTSIPDAPIGLTARAKELGQIQLTWNAINDATIAGYNVYRSSVPFTAINEAQKANSTLVKTGNWLDMPAEDGEYYYRIAAVNTSSTEGALSSSAQSIVDSTPPVLNQVTYTADENGSYDSVTERFGVGVVSLDLFFSEALLTKPYFSIVAGGVPTLVAVSADVDDPTHYVGTYTISPTTPSGTAYAVMSAYDIAANKGYDIDVGATIEIDTQGPQVTSIQLTPASPIKNVLGANSQGTQVSVTLTTNDYVQDGSVPVLIPNLDGLPIPGYDSGITLQSQSLGADVPAAWQGQFDLPFDVDETIDVQTLSFTWQAVDDMDNVTNKITAKNQYQVYRTGLPPLNTPFGLAGKALPGGKVQLSWLPISESSGYRLYRQTLNEDPVAIEVSGGDTVEFVDDGDGLGLVDGQTYWYSIATQRQENGETSYSAASIEIEVLVDAVAPSAPYGLAAQLDGAGVYLTWTAPAGEAASAIKYNLYRLNLEGGQQLALTDLEGIEPLQTGLPAAEALDPQPSDIDRAYLVTAVDNAGNESEPTPTVYLNDDLYPAANLSIVLEEGAYPVLSWEHNGTNVGFRVYSGEADDLLSNQLLTSELLSTQEYTDTDYPLAAQANGASVERRYAVVAEDDNQQTSEPHYLRLPALAASLATVDDQGNEITPVLKRNLMNQVYFKVDNQGQTTAQQVTLLVTLTINGQEYVHQSAPFNVDALNYTIVPVVIGGYSELDYQVDIKTSLVLTPNAGETVSINQAALLQVLDATLPIRLLTDEFTRAGTGKVRIQIENTSEVEIEMLLARNNGNSDSNQVRLQLQNDNGDVISVKSVLQFTGDVITLTNGDTVARIAPGATFTSDEFEIPVPDASPEQVKVILQIDQLHYHLGRPDHVAVNSIGATQFVSLVDTAYYVTIDSVTPQEVWAGNSVTVTGQAIDRQLGTPLSNTAIKVIASVNGFERATLATTDNNGVYELNLVTRTSDAGTFKLSAIHPVVVERPEQATYLVRNVGVTPSAINATLGRNYEQPINLKVSSGAGTGLNNVRVEYLAEDQTNHFFPIGIELAPPEPINVAAASSAYLKLTMTASNESLAMGMLRLRVVADDPDGVEESILLSNVTLNYSVVDTKPTVYFTPAYISTGVAQQSTNVETLRIANKGLQPLTGGVVTIEGPANSANLVTVKDATVDPQVPENLILNIGDLDVGEEFDLNFVIDSTTALVGIYNYTVKVDSNELSSETTNLSVVVSSDEVGNVVFRVSDNYTATLDDNGQPIQGVSGAKIMLRNMDTLEELYYAADSTGDLIASSIPVGRYTYRVSALDHNDTGGTVWIKPGITQTVDVLLPNNFVTVEWTVNEITLEDRYEIKLEATYKTFVPAGVLAIEPKYINLPNMKQGEVLQGELAVMNLGLIRTDNVQMRFPESDSYAQFEFMGEVPESLLPNDYILIPYKITALRDFDNDGSGAVTGGGCFNLNWSGLLTGSYVCANGSISNASSSIGIGANGSQGSCGGGGGSGSVGIITLMSSLSNGGGGFGPGPAFAGPDGGFCSAQRSCDDGDGDGSCDPYNREPK